MEKFDFKSFKKDTAKLPKNHLIKLYLWLHTPDAMMSHNGYGLDESDVEKIRIIVKEILQENYECEVGDILMGYHHVIS